MYSFLFLYTYPFPITTFFPYTTLFRSGLPPPKTRGLKNRAPEPRGAAPHPPQERKGSPRRPAAPSPGPPPGSCRGRGKDRKSTRLNSSHVSISYAVFCLKKKKQTP